MTYPIYTTIDVPDLCEPDGGYQFRGEPRRYYRLVRIEEPGDAGQVLAWHNVGWHGTDGYYTSRHDLTEVQMAAARRQAAKIVASRAPEVT